MTRERVPPLWLCVDWASLAESPGPDIVARIGAISARIATVVWLRPSAATPARSLWEFGRMLQPGLHEHGALLAIGDRLDVAAALCADIVHLTSRSVTIADARAWWVKTLSARLGRITAAVHDAAQVHASRAADALILSPFGSVDDKGTALGIAGFSVARSSAPARPVVALGGILSDADARAAARAGANSIALRRVFLARDGAERSVSLASAFTAATDQTLDPAASW